MADASHLSSHGDVVNILLVDDRPDGLLALEAVLAKPGYRLVMASSGAEALAYLLKEQFALILMDVQMPELDGFETAQLIRQNPRTRVIPIIFLTAINKNDRYVTLGYEHGAVDYLFKPFEPEILKAKVAVFASLFQKSRELERQQAALARLNEELEDRVRVRTSDLHKANAELLKVNQELGREVGERKRAEESLRKHAAELARSNFDLEQFAYVASHDLQEPLRMVASYVQMLERRYKGQLDGEADEFIHFAVDGAKRMQSLINDLLRYSTLGANKVPFEDVACDEILQDATANLRRSIETSEAHVSWRDLPTIYGDSTQLSQLFQNLIGNAIKFRSKQPPVIDIRCERNGTHWLFEVKDNGIGIDPAYAEKIFIIFKRLHQNSEYAGTGIGLALCKKIVERHGGRIWVESSVGNGARFLFTLPLHTAAETSDGNGHESATPNRQLTEKDSERNGSSAGDLPVSQAHVVPASAA
ncbi:MAG: response regulator [Verrucomicrobiae bacterium]|nr:response regulator [Verrucomicrobiae bacterium]